MAAKLVAEEGHLKGLVLTFDDGNEWIVGRDPDVSQKVVEDPSVSRRHVLFRATLKGIEAENLSTTNPVAINGQELATKRLMQPGDEVRIGTGIYRFYADERKTKEEGSMEPREDTNFDEKAPAGKDALAEINFEVVETGRWLLKVIGGPNNGAEYAMQAGNSYVIGTDPNSCDIVFNDTSVSRQHARITVGDDDKLYIEDLKSRNGTLLDGEPLKTRKLLTPNTLITMGTTSFIVYDREGEMQTIISPLLPSIVKVLQKEDTSPKGPVGPSASEAAAVKKADQLQKELEAKHLADKHTHAFSRNVLFAILAGLLLIVGLGTMTLFKGEPVARQEQIDYNKVLADVMAPFPSIKWSFNQSTGRLLLVGHVLSANDKNQLLYNLQGMKFIKSYDDSGVIIDEFVWQEINQLLSNNPLWRGITVQATSPGQFVLMGSLQTRKQAEQLYQYISENFRYLDRLDKKVVVDEDVIAQATTDLAPLNIKNMAVQLSNGELSVSGNIPNNKLPDFEGVLANLRKIPGVRLVRNYITELPPEASMVNISDKYAVSGYSTQGNNTTSVVINGRILSKGDTLDGMTITSIDPNAVMLLKDNVKYRIDYSK